jgi:hypothetical protein
MRIGGAATGCAHHDTVEVSRYGDIAASRKPVPVRPSPHHVMTEKLGSGGMGVGSVNGVPFFAAHGQSNLERAEDTLGHALNAPAGPPKRLTLGRQQKLAGRKPSYTSNRKYLPHR